MPHKVIQGWVETALTADVFTAMKAGLEAQIAEKITPTSATKTIG
jgi:hypothetical protein